MKDIYLIFSNMHTKTSTVVSIATKDAYAHVSISLDNNFDTMYAFGRKYNITPLIGCFKTESLNSGLFKKNNAQIKIYKITVTDESYSKLKQEIYLLSPKKNKYNYIGAFTMIFGVKLERTSKYFCSEFIARILESANIFKFDKRAALISPKYIMQNISNSAKCVYEGTVIDFMK